MAGGAERAVSSSSERRRATHNEVSFDMIFKAISYLAKLPHNFSPLFLLINHLLHCLKVERRRRDTINNMIVKLGKLIPDLFNPEAGPPKNNTLSKGGILARACEYVSEIRQSNQSLREKATKTDKLV